MLALCGEVIKEKKTKLETISNEIEIMQIDVDEKHLEFAKVLDEIKPLREMLESSLSTQQCILFERIESYALNIKTKRRM